MTDQSKDGGPALAEEKFLEMVNDVVAQRDYGKPSAVKRGRNTRWPYVPVIDHGVQSVGVHRTRTEQVMGCAYATREEAIAQACKAIQARQDDFRTKLLTPNMRALREQWALPRNVPGWTDEGDITKGAALRSILADAMLAQRAKKEGGE